MSCLQTIGDFALRSIYGIRLPGIGAIEIGEKSLPKTDFTLCQQATLIGSGLIWNIYFGMLALAVGFVLATALAVAKNSGRPWLSRPASLFIFVFRGSPLLIQFFLAYLLFLAVKKPLPFLSPFTGAALGALVVLILNTTAYSAEIFLGALRSVPRGDIEAADAYGLTGWRRFRRVLWPTTLRLAWPAYTNEAIFLFHATTLVFFTGFPALQQRGDALYYAQYLADKTYNPFIPYPIVAVYFVLVTLTLTWLFGRVNRRLNRHLPGNLRTRLKIRPQLIR